MLFIAFIFLFIFLGWVYRKNNLIFIVLILICILIAGLNYSNPDFDNYVQLYEWASFPEQFNIFNVLDIGYVVLQSFSKELGYDYAYFRLLLCLGIFIIWGITIGNSCKYKNLYAIIYIVFYLALDQIQLRNFASFVLLLPFMLFYIKQPSKKGLFFYMIGILIAFTIHFSAIFYSIFGLCTIRSKKIRQVVIVFISLLLGIGSIGISHLALMNRVSDYEQPSLIGALVSLSWFIFVYIYILWIRNKTNPYIKSTILCQHFNVIVQFNYLLLFISPLVFMNASILRIWRFMSMVNLIYIINVLYVCRRQRIKSKLTFSFILYAALVSLWMSPQGVYPSMFNNPCLE